MDVNYQLSNCVYSSACQDNIVLDPSYSKLLSSNTIVILCAMTISDGQNFAESWLRQKNARSCPWRAKIYIIAYVSMAVCNLLILGTSRPWKHRKKHIRNKLLLPPPIEAVSFEKQPSFVMGFTTVRRVIQKYER